MTRGWSLLLLGVVCAIFLIGVMDAFVDPTHRLIPEQIMSVAAVILAGVAIGSILAGLRANGHGADPDDPTEGRARQSAREAQHEMGDDDGGN